MKNLAGSAGVVPRDPGCVSGPGSLVVVAVVMWGIAFWASSNQDAAAAAVALPVFSMTTATLHQYKLQYINLAL